MPRVLIADDDPVSLRFLAAAIRQLGCEVVEAAGGSSACAAAQSQLFDLMLLDRCMPDLGGAALLAAMRSAGIRVPAIATSAEIDAAISTELDAAGFTAVIAKPMALPELYRVLDSHLHFGASPARDEPGTQTLLDDAAALAAVGGDATALRALRALLAEEIAALSTQLGDFKQADDPSPVRAHLHRLRASCGFCGATALADAAVRLDGALREDQASVPSALGGFLQQCRSTQAILSPQAPSATADTRASPSIPQARSPTPSK